MRRIALALTLAGTPLIAQQQQSANPAVNAAKSSWSVAQNYLVRSAEQMPESLYSFRPTPVVRSFGQILGHVAGSQYMYCAAVLGEPPRREDSIEKTATSKADLVKAIRESGAYCERAYAIADADSQGAISMFGQNTTKLAALIDNVGHDMEHYGNLITYFRIKGMVPPSSQ